MRAVMKLVRVAFTGIVVGLLLGFIPLAAIEFFWPGTVGTIWVAPLMTGVAGAAAACVQLGLTKKPERKPVLAVLADVMPRRFVFPAFVAVLGLPAFMGIVLSEVESKLGLSITLLIVIVVLLIPALFSGHSTEKSRLATQALILEFATKILTASDFDEAKKVAENYAKGSRRQIDTTQHPVVHG